MAVRIPASLLAAMALATALLLPSCGTGNPVDNGPSLVGSWLVTTVNNQDASSFAMSVVFSDTRYTYTGINGCRAVASYMTSGSRLITTQITDECLQTSAGVQDTINFSISGDRMTLTQGNDILVLKKGAVNVLPSLAGTWNVDTINGVPPGNGETRTLVFDFTSMTRKIVSGSGSCQTVFDYTRVADRIDIELVSDDCGSGLNVGDKDVVTYTISGNTLTLVFSDGTTLVATKG